MNPLPDTPLAFALLVAVLDGIVSSKNVAGRRKELLKDIFLRLFRTSIDHRGFARVRDEITCANALSVDQSLLILIQLRNQDKILMQPTRAPLVASQKCLSNTTSRKQRSARRRSGNLLRIRTREVMDSGNAITSHPDAISSFVNLPTQHLPLLIRDTGNDNADVEMID
jgi:hypothetical protein